MSLNTLLQAAQWVESNNEKTREDSSRHFHHYAKSPSVSEDNSDGRGDDSRDKRRTGGAGTREVHNKLEKNRRAHLKECFDALKQHLSSKEEKKTSNLSILRGAIKCIQNLRRCEKELEQELQKLAQQKSKLRHRLEQLYSEMDQMNVKVDIECFMQQASEDQESNSTNTATEGPESTRASDVEEDEEQEAPPPPRPIARAIPHPVIRTLSSANPPTMNPSISLPASIAVGTIAVPASPTSQPLNLVVTSVAVPTTTTITGSQATSQPTPLLVRPPVTQILQQTLEKRQAQNRQQQSGTSQVTAVPSSVGVRQAIKAMPAVSPVALTPGAVNFPSVVSLMPGAGNMAKLGGVALSGTQPKTLGQSILLSSAHGLPHPSGNSQATVLPASVIAPIRAINTLTTGGVTTSTTSGAAPVTANQLARPILTAAVQGTGGTTTQQVLATTPMAFGHHPLLAQLPRGASLPGVGVGVGGFPVVCLGAGAQIVPPMTVMTQGLLSPVLSGPLIKQVPLHHILPGTQVLQHTQQQTQQSVVNPLVVVSVPSVVTTTAITTTAVSVTR
ncbi:max-binding protein MNT-like isoform X2 [Pomacea canaliculata]|uniref:max-binding protein MNT-like isoform X2 n=1 Tax=Pomacea canaliculata TaxID=400727 RepID=UPI000D727C5E|nr:max-binding protein MNT-like isoform X2 [Pomacea canaliculata]